MPVLYGLRVLQEAWALQHGELERLPRLGFVSLRTCLRCALVFGAWLIRDAGQCSRDRPQWFIPPPPPPRARASVVAMYGLLLPGTLCTTCTNVMNESYMRV